MTKKSRNTDKERLALAATSPIPPDFDPDFGNTFAVTDPAEERAWYKRRGLPMPEEYQEGYDPVDEDERRAAYVDDKKFNPVRIISPKNAKYPD